ncbi:hypothetical protein KY289_016897 [Solanum tuberosum]|nr:hypothetical protein KY284_016694 [Solanum tuberosum]KAH0689539.1 hypothetical protein KY289_016897 [Solanum tuberosum]
MARQINPLTDLPSKNICAISCTGLEIKASQDFKTDLNFKSDFTGTLERISVMSYVGNTGIVIKTEPFIEVEDLGV